MSSGSVYTSGAEGPYFEGLLHGDVRLPACGDCGRWHWPAVFRCPDCGSWQTVWHTVEADGRIYSWTRTWHAFAGAETLDTPYVSVVVELAHPSRVRLIGILREEGGEFGIGSEVSGHPWAVGSGPDAVPAIVWTLK